MKRSLNNLHIAFPLVASLLVVTGIQAQSIINQHILEVHLEQTSALNKMHVNSSTSSFSDNLFSSIYESDFDISSVNDIRLHKVLNSDIVELEFYIEPENNELNIGFQEYQNIVNNNNYVFDFSGAPNMYRIAAPGYLSQFESYDIDTNFRILKCPNGFAFLVDNVTVKLIPVDPNAITQYEGKVAVQSAPGTDVLLYFKQLDDCVNVDRYNKFSVLKTAIPVSETLIENRELNFYYLQKYAIVKDQNDTIKVTILSNDNTEMYTTQLPNIYGSNFHSINLDDIGNQTALPPLTNCLLKVENANKGLIYYLRITEKL